MTAYILMQKQIRYLDIIIKSYYDRTVRSAFRGLRRFGGKYINFRHVEEVIKRGHNGLRKRKKRYV